MDYHKALQAVAALLQGGDGGGSFDTDTRLHHIECDGLLSKGLVEAWCLREELNQPWRLEVSVLALEERSEGLRDELVCAFFDNHVHDSLADFDMDATLPSDPRVIYIGGDVKMRHSKAEPAGVPETALG